MPEATLTAHAVAAAEISQDTSVYAPDGTWLRNHHIVALDGVPATASQVLANLGGEEGGMSPEATLTLRFEPTDEQIKKRGPDEWNPFTLPENRPQLARGKEGAPVLRTVLAYKEWLRSHRLRFATEERPGGLVWQVVADDPIIITVDDLFSAETAQLIIEQAKPRMRDSTVSLVTQTQTTGDRELQDTDSANVKHPARSGQQTWLEHSTHPHLQSLVDTCADLVGLSSQHAEAMQVVNYKTRQQYQMHWDSYEIHTDLGKHEMNNSMVGDAGQRLVTVLGYLHNVTAGGETAFQHLRTNIKAKIGRVVVFHNCLPGTISRHADAVRTAFPRMLSETKNTSV